MNLIVMVVEQIKATFGLLSLIRGAGIGSKVTGQLRAQLSIRISVSTQIKDMATLESNGASRDVHSRQSQEGAHRW